MFCMFLLFNYTENQLCNLIWTKSRRVGCEQKKGYMFCAFLLRVEQNHEVILRLASLQTGRQCRKGRWLLCRDRKLGCLSTMSLISPFIISYIHNPALSLKLNNAGVRGEQNHEAILQLSSFEARRDKLKGKVPKHNLDSTHIAFIASQIPTKCNTWCMLIRKNCKCLL